LVSALLVVPAHAQLTQPKDTKATLTVGFAYESSGSQPDRPGNPVATQWRVKRSVSVTATLQAKAPAGLPVVHAPDAAVKAGMSDVQQRTQQATTQAQPMMQNAMAMIAKCGEDEACLAREAAAMGAAMQGNKQAEDAFKSSAAAGNAQAALAGTGRYQLWQATAQSPSQYSVDEELHEQTRDPICLGHPKDTCKTDDIIKGSGTLPATGSPSGQFEIDTQTGTVAFRFPVPPIVLPATLTRTGDHPEKKAGASQQQVTLVAGGSKVPGVTEGTLTAAIKDVRNASGSQTFDVDGGDFGKKGKLTINWRISVP
jgi:hypothetical protein